jgi:hypothetical protein
MSLEHQLAVGAGKASLLDSLSFDVPPSAPYITTRRSCYSYPSTGTTYSYATQRVLRIPITSDGGEWLDPNTLRVQLTLTNTSSKKQAGNRSYLVLKITSKLNEELNFFLFVDVVCIFFKRKRIRKGNNGIP